MLEIKYVRQNLSEVYNTLKNRRDSADLEAFQAAETNRREMLAEIEELRHQRNVVSDEIAGMKKKGEDAGDRVVQMREVSGRIKTIEKSLAESEDILQEILIRLPNIPHMSVPVGKDEADNPVNRVVGTPRVFDFEPKAHWTIGEDLKILDFERASKITGAR
ncbi:MAG: serine--tRNA ligase, partial [Desulfosalsimonadaceae bacterium]|nr:serine--tRNA ligase [Desulfosalsimonadaceae bacterium]